MKRVKTVNGFSTIADAPPGSQALYDLLKPLLEAHRDKIVKRVVDNLDVYIDYRFHIKLNNDKLNNLRDRISSLKGTGIDPGMGMLSIKETGKDFIYLGTKPFYEEIDRTIEWSLK